MHKEIVLTGRRAGTHAVVLFNSSG